MAALVHPLLRQDSDHNLVAIWSWARGLSRLSEESIRTVDQAIDATWVLPFEIRLGEKVLTAAEVVRAYGDGKYFRDDDRARGELEELSIGPMAPLIEVSFHDFIARFASLAVRVAEILTTNGILPSALQAPSEPRCIYCKTTAGTFRGEEHVIPESLGGDEIILTNQVCDECNNRLSKLDQWLVEFEPIAFLRAVFGPMTKKGKFPRGESRELTIERTAPRAVKVVHKTGQRVSPPVIDGEGFVRFTTKMTSRERFDPRKLARSLFKIGLGLVAHDAGVDAALDSRYDGAREFISNGGPFSGYLALLNTSTPNGELSTWWLPDPGTPMRLTFFGVDVVFHLEAAARKPEIESQTADDYSLFWLGDDA